MRIMTMAAILLALACAATSKPATAADQAMTHMVFRFVADGLDPDSFAATSREMWRVGDRHMRLQEAPDPERKIHGLIVMNSPDSWVVNLYDNSARHAVDRSESIGVHVPVFPGTPSESLNALEFGREAEFFRERGAKVAGSGIIGGRHATASVLIVDGIQLTLYVGDDGLPWQVAIRVGAQEWAIRYESYEAGLDPDWSLFQPPEDVEIVEAE